MQNVQRQGAALVESASIPAFGRSLFLTSNGIGRGDASLPKPIFTPEVSTLTTPPGKTNLIRLLILHADAGIAAIAQRPYLQFQ